jgi:hypothetical protein
VCGKSVRRNGRTHTLPVRKLRWYDRRERELNGITNQRALERFSGGSRDGNGALSRPRLLCYSIQENPRMLRVMKGRLTPHQEKMIRQKKMWLHQNHQLFYSVQIVDESDTLTSCFTRQRKNPSSSLVADESLPFG